MPRQARLAVGAQVYHVVSRGNNRERIFWDDDDFAAYLDLCRRYKERDGFRLYQGVCGDRSREEEEFLMRTANGCIGREGFAEFIRRQSVEQRRPKRGRPKIAVNTRK